MKYVGLLLLLVGLTAVGSYGTSLEFKVHGNQAILVELKDGLPPPTTRDGVTSRLPAFVARSGEFAVQFAVEATNPIMSVSVDDITEATPLSVLESAPQEEGSKYWMDVSTPQELSRRATPWVFEKNDTLRVFRITVVLSGRSQPVELIQPVLWNLASKKQLRKLAR